MQLRLTADADDPRKLGARADYTRSGLTSEGEGQ